MADASLELPDAPPESSSVSPPAEPASNSHVREGVDARMSQLMDLFMPFFSGPGTDEYGKEESGPLPLSFMQINSGFPSTTNFSLLQKLPMELVDHVVSYLQKEDLKMLARVDRDCRQLARARLFSTVLMDCTGASREMIGKLLGEMVEAKTHGVQRHTLGACIRRVVVAPNTDYLTNVFGVGIYDKEKAMFRMNADERRAFEEAERKNERNACQFYFDTYRPALLEVIKGAMPNLDCLEWLDRTCVTAETMNAIAQAPIRHLKLDNRSPIETDFEVTTPTTEQRWQLRSLKLDIIGPIWSTKKLDVMPLVKSILRVNQNTLETLQWEASHVSLINKDFTMSWGDDDIRFTSLRALHLTGCERFDDTFFDAFTASPFLHTIDIPEPRRGQRAYINFARGGHLPKLKTFNIGGLAIDDDSQTALFSILTANPQITSLTATYACPVEFIDKLLPVLREMRLERLHLKWQSRVVPGKHWVQIGRMRSLRKLWVSAGNQFGIRHNWFVEHREVLEALRGLGALEMLAFTQDTYRVCNDWVYTGEDEDEMDEEQLAQEQVMGQDEQATDQPQEPVQQDTDPAAAQENQTPSGETPETPEDDPWEYHLPTAPLLEGDPTTSIDGQNLHATEQYYYERYTLPDEGPTTSEILADHPELNAPPEPRLNLITENIEEWTNLMEQRRTMAWEHWHLTRMQNVVDAYEEAFPGLKWMLVGKRPFKVDEECGARGLVPCTEGRDECWHFLKREFGMGEE